MSLFQTIPRPTKTYHTQTYDRIAKHHGFDGRGKTVLITGGATGVGFSIAKAFAEAGVARIAIVSRSPGPQETAKADLQAAHPAVQVLTYSTSVTDSTRLIEILSELGTVDILVLSAAAAHRRAPGTEITEQEVRDAFETNVLATFTLVRAFLRMPPTTTTAPAAPAPARTIIHLSSAAIQVSGQRVAYGPSKAAATQMMQQFAAEVDAAQVRIFSVHPGALYTPGTAQLFPREAMQWEDLALPAHFALWLAGPESAFLHGRYLWAQWDVDELLGLRERVAGDGFFLKIGLAL
ncbi:putative NADP(+)-dependent dehydrogenase [Chaetomium fimeti]|uniref:NADP(+)-dependent dehydrogenase n=1 Tax=Chaetomium fimeti TaxID=1854472 RepID=A0AAE0H7H9_9PEZI|nr:putative NADP(+)-dependent dehydrogenase [Chaetomium fimeti]